METMQLTNEKFRLGSVGRTVLIILFIGITVFLTKLASSTQAVVVIVGLAFIGFWGLRHLYRRGVIRYTLTNTHLQQHTYKGGWVIQWQNILAIGLCESHNSINNPPLPWIGIRLKNPLLFIDAICPRVGTAILLEQRALLYLGAREHSEEDQFQDKVLESAPVIINSETKLIGLQASLFHRMKQQRIYWGYDIFISTSDLDRPADDFVGLLRRYWAASQTDAD